MSLQASHVPAMSFFLWIVVCLLSFFVPWLKRAWIFLCKPSSPMLTSVLREIRGSHFSNLVCKASLIETQKILLHWNSTSKITEEFQPGRLRVAKIFLEKRRKLNHDPQARNQGLEHYWKKYITNKQTNKQPTFLIEFLKGFADMLLDLESLECYY